MIIDFHAHVFPDKIAERASRGIETFYDLKVRNDGTLGRLIQMEDEAGVDMAVVHSAATTAHQVVSINDFIYECTQKYPDRIIGFMTIHPDFDDIEGEVRRCMDLGLKGLKIHPDFQHFHIDDKKAYKIYEVIRGRLPLLVHTGDFRYQWSKPSRMAKVAEDFPDMTVIGAHFGGWSEWDDAAEVFDGCKNRIYVDTSSTMYDVAPARIRELIKIYGEDRVMFGTDYPMWNAVDELKYIDALDLSPSVREMILSGNAERLLGINP